MWPLDGAWSVGRSIDASAGDATRGLAVPCGTDRVGTAGRFVSRRVGRHFAVQA